MEAKPIPLIVLKNYEYQVTDTGLEFLRSLTGNLGIISIVGKYRTGKSFLLNKLLLNGRKGFNVGPTIHTCTKGIWIWNQTIPVRTGEGEDLELLVLDSEGFGAFDEDPNHDTRIFLLSLLLSSYLVYNSIGNIDETTLQGLNLVVNIGQNLKDKLGSDSESFPSLMWVLRDFALRLEDNNGNKITTQEYLEQSLAQKNKINNALRNVFKDRDCFALIRPTESEINLQALDSAPDHVFRQEFLSQITQLKNVICQKVRPKTIKGVKMNGEMLGEVIRIYTNAINTNSIPYIDNLWNNLCQVEGQKAMEKSMELFDLDLKIMNFPVENIEESIESATKKCEIMLKEKIIGENKDNWVELFQSEIKQKSDYYKEINRREVIKYTNKCVEEFWTEEMDKLRSEEITDIQTVLEDINTLIKSEDKLLNKDIVRERYGKLLTEASEYLLAKAFVKSENEKKVLRSWGESINQKLEQSKSDLEILKDHYEEKLDYKNTEMNYAYSELSKTTIKLDELSKEKDKICEDYESRIIYLKTHYKKKISKLKTENQGFMEEIERLKNESKDIPIQSANSYILYDKIKEWNSEKEKLLSHIHCLNQQLENKKTIQEELISAVHKDAVKGDLNEINKNLSMSLKKAEERSSDLEGKLKKMKKYKKYKQLVKNCSGFQCKKCLKCFELEQLSTHVCKIDENIHITVSQVVVLEDGKPLTDYILDVNCNKDKWSVKRRFKDFCALQIALHKEFTHVKLPDSTAIFNLGNALSRTLMVVSERKKAIQDYLNKLAKIQEIKDSEVFANFIGTQSTGSVLKPITNYSQED